MKPTYPRLPDAELEVMKALWSLGDYPAHTGDIAQKLDKSWKAPTLMKHRVLYTLLVRELLGIFIHQPV